MARRRRHKISGWTMFGVVILLGLLFGPTVVTICFVMALFKALHNSD